MDLTMPLTPSTTRTQQEALSGIKRCSSNDMNGATSLFGSRCTTKRYRSPAQTREQSQQQFQVRRVKVIFGSICTALLAILVATIVVQNHFPNTRLGQILRSKPTCSSGTPLEINYDAYSASKYLLHEMTSTSHQFKNDSQPKRRRMEDQEGEDNNGDQEEQQQDDDEEGDNEDEQQQNEDGEENENEQQDENEQQQEEEEEANDDDLNEGDAQEQQQDDYYHYHDDYVTVEPTFTPTSFPTEMPVVIIDDDFYAFQEDPGPPRLLPLSSRDVAAFLIASMGLTLGASGGIGGGGIVVPVYILVAGLTPKIAIPLGAVTVMGGSIASTYMNSQRRHPLADRPIIDWDLVLVTEPLTLIGALCGVLLHRVMSEKVLIVLLVLLLSVSAHSTLAKAKRMHDAETRYIRKLKANHSMEAAHFHTEVHQLPLSPQEVKSSKHPSVLLPTVAKPDRDDPNSQYFGAGSVSPIGPSATFIPYSVKADDDDLSNMACENNENTTLGDTLDNGLSFELDGDDMLKLQKSLSETSTPRQMGAEEKQQILILNPDFVTMRSGLMEQEKYTPRSKIVALCLMFSILMFLNIMIGGGAFPSPWGIQCGSVAFWVVHVIMVAFLVASAWAAQTYLVNRHEMKEIVRFDYVHGDIKWDSRSALIYPALFVCAGTFAGIFGIGGGMITVPLMLAMGVHPGVVSATSSAMILFTSVASVTSFLVFDLILYDYALVCVTVGFFASLFGNRVMRQARQAKSANGRNFERNSYIAFCIGGIILASALLMTIDYVFRVYAFDDMDIPESLCDGYRV